MKTSILSLPRTGNSVIGILMAGIALLAGGCPPPAVEVKPADRIQTRTAAKALVVVHSRTGNTASAAKKLAELLHGDFVHLEGPKGEGDNWSAPKRSEQIPYSPPTVDLAPYELIVLGSPIWWYYPTAVIYSFIRNHNLAGKRVILLYTNEGGIRDGAMAEWTQLVESRGGKVIEMIAINRKQTADTPMAEVIRKMVTPKLPTWQAGAPSPR